jgi:nucleotide-binding universal stress UspA family protein
MSHLQQHTGSGRRDRKRPLAVDRREHRGVSTLGTAPRSGSGRIVVGVDGSSSSEEALRWALRHARLTGQPVEALTSWEIPVNFSVGPLTDVDWEGQATSTLRDAVAKAVDPADAERVTQRVVKGHPAQVLIDAASDAGLVVIGSRGRGGFTGMLLGSVSQHVLARATCPVVIVRGTGTKTGTRHR